jgi:hypothetical protein
VAVAVVAVALAVVGAAFVAARDDDTARATATDGTATVEGTTAGHDWELTLSNDGERCLEITFDGGRSGSCAGTAAVTFSSGAPTDAGDGSPVYVYGYAPAGTARAELVMSDGSVRDGVTLTDAAGAVVYVAVHRWEENAAEVAAYDADGNELGRAAHPTGNS